MKVLVMRFSSIGDIVLTTPVLRCLKNQVPGIEIHYLTKPSFRALLGSNPHIHKIHVLENTLGDTIDELKAERFDCLVDLHHNLRTSVIKFRLGVKSYSFNKLNLHKWLLVRLRINILPPVHIVNRYLDTVKPLGVRDDGLGLDYFFSKTHTIDCILPVTHQENYVAIVIGGQHFTKRLPVYKLAQVCGILTGPVVLLGGKEDGANADEIVKAVDGDHVLNMCGKLTLDESAFVVKNARRIITHDTGLMHIAAAFNKPITSVWGNTVPEFGMNPYKVTDSKIIENKELSCRPCSKIGYEKCPLGHFKCMNGLNPQVIAES